MNKVMLAFAILALGIVSAAPKTLHMTLASSAWVGGNELKPGDYKVEVNDNSVVFKLGKTSTEAKAKVEEGANKILSTTVNVDGDTQQLKEIRLGGTNKIIVLEKSGAASGN